MIIFSDLHVEPKSAATAFEVLRQIPNVCAARDDFYVACLGDFFTTRHAIPVRLLVEVREELLAWKKRGVKRVDVLVGNHDVYDVAGRNVLEVFDHLGGFVFVHSQPEWTVNGFWLPYRSNEGLRAALAQANVAAHPQVPFLFAHCGIQGAWMNSLKRDDFGLTPEEVLGAGFKRVLLGHYHRHGLVTKGISYIGSPYQVSYGEAGQAKGVCRWDGRALEFIPWEIGPKHHKIVFDADNPAPLSLPTLREGDRAWVVVKGQMAKAAQHAVQEALKKSGLEPSRVEIDYQPEERASRIDIHPGEEHRSLASRFVEAQDIDPSYQSMLKETLARVVPT